MENRVIIHDKKALLGRKKQWSLFTKEELIDAIIEKEHTVDKLIYAITFKL